MSKIVACYKWVIDDAELKIKKDLSVEKPAESKLSDYDRNIIEAAVRAAKTCGGEAVGLTYGSAQSKVANKHALSRGLKESYWIGSDTAVTADNKVIADALAAAIGKMEDVSLVICSDGAGDTLSRQTAPRIGGLLDWPVVTAVVELKMEGDTLVATKKLEDCREIVKVPLPAVISVLPEINPAPLPGLAAIMGASKKKTEEVKAEELGVEFTSNSAVTGIIGYAMDRKNIVQKDGDVADMVKELAVALKKEGVL